MNETVNDPNVTSLCNSIQRNGFSKNCIKQQLNSRLEKITHSDLGQILQMCSLDTKPVFLGTECFGDYNNNDYVPVLIFILIILAIILFLKK